jgi:plasmid stability protein
MPAANRTARAGNPSYATTFDSPMTLRSVPAAGKAGLPPPCYQTCIQNVVMAQAIVRKLDDEVVASLKLKAKLKGRSLEQELRDILKRAAELTKEEKLALIDSIRAKQKRPLEHDSADLIREDRDSR